MLHTELTRKLTSTDAALKDSISKLVRSKVTVELMSFHSTGRKYIQEEHLVDRNKVVIEDTENCCRQRVTFKCVMKTKHHIQLQC